VDFFRLGRCLFRRFLFHFVVFFEFGAADDSIGLSLCRSLFVLGFDKP